MRLSPQEAAAKLAKMRQPKAIPSIREPVTGATRPPLAYKHAIIGLASPEELREKVALQQQQAPEKTKKRAANYKGPWRVTCPCGTEFEFPRNYPHDGRKYCSKACRKKYGNKRGAYEFTPESDEQIRLFYEEKIGMDHKPAMKELSAKLGIPSYAIRRRSLALDIMIAPLFPKGRKPAVWCGEEKQIVRENAALCPAIIRKKLKKAGFERSDSAIKIFITRKMGGKPKTAYSATMLAKCMGIDGHRVTRWIHQKLIKATSAQTARLPQQGGDAYLIDPAEVREFVIKYIALIDLRKVDKFWLVELLTGREIELVN